MPEHADLFGRAALVAREPERFDSLSELDEGERSALAVRSFSQMARSFHALVLDCFVCCRCRYARMGSDWVQWGPTCHSLRNLVLPKTALDEWIVGIINAIIFLTAGLM